MIPELGQYCLILALLASLVQAGVPLLQRLNRPYDLLHLTKATATLMLLLVSASFAALIYAYVVSDFSVLTVVLNSHSSKPLLYKIVGAWGNHEGSMLLWMWVLAACGFLVAYLHARDRELQAYTLAILGLLSAGILAFILFTSNPFLRVFPAPANGEDLNPILQD
ncbi:MAG: cytochrome c biogenesis protein CcsA, partial [Rickettsiales bacterium]|nr:cytochrome c biogenesis protein CcsA [Rickettsiales bacterium]